MKMAAPISVLAGLWACVVVSTGAGAAEPSIVLDKARLTAAGVTFSTATAPNAADGDSIRLSGLVLVPNAALDLILAPVEGRIEALLVNPGQKVRAGQAVARINSAELISMQRALISARTRTAAAISRAERDAQLHAEGIISRSRLEESQALRTEAEAQTEEQAQLLRLAGLSQAAVDGIRAINDITPALILVARRDSEVLQQLAGAGEAVQGGMPILRLGRLDTLWIELQATREQARHIRAGDTIRVADCAATANVIGTAPQLGEQSQTVTIRAELPRAGGCIAPNQFVEARLAPRADTQGFVQVPAASVIRRENKDYVFVRTARGVEPREVEVERRNKEAAWIRGAVNPGDSVAITGIAALKGSWQGLGAQEAH